MFLDGERKPGIVVAASAPTAKPRHAQQSAVTGHFIASG
jgi:hypothetical protein